MMSTISFIPASALATTIRRACTGISLSAIRFTTDGPRLDGCPLIRTPMGTGTDGLTTDMVPDTILMGTVDTIPMGTIADIRTSYIPVISAILSRVEEQARQEMQDIDARAAVHALEDTLGPL